MRHSGLSTSLQSYRCLQFLLDIGMVHFHGLVRLLNVDAQVFEILADCVLRAKIH